MIPIEIHKPLAPLSRPAGSVEVAGVALKHYVACLERVPTRGLRHERCARWRRRELVGWRHGVCVAVRVLQELVGLAGLRGAVLVVGLCVVGAGLGGLAGLRSAVSVAGAEGSFGRHT